MLATTAHFPLPVFLLVRECVTHHGPQTNENVQGADAAGGHLRRALHHGWHGGCRPSGDIPHAGRRGQEQSGVGREGVMNILPGRDMICTKQVWSSVIVVRPKESIHQEQSDYTTIAPLRSGRIFSTSQISSDCSSSHHRRTISTAIPISRSKTHYIDQMSVVRACFY